MPAADISAKVHDTPNAMALLPAALVTPSVKVLPIGEADLFGSPKHRALPYPLVATVAAATSWTDYNAADIRTLISTGDTCPDRGVSHETVVLKKGWDWALDGGHAHYTGFFRHPWGWPVPHISRTGDTGAVSALVADNDVSANDFECPLVSNWKQHETGTVFNIDPRVAGMLATKGGLKAVTLGSNHITDAGEKGIRDTLKFLDAAGIKHTGAGL
jgi:poly-gamma-glutamate synthesis protein (capsule biosynthesis protein)